MFMNTIQSVITYQSSFYKPSAGPLSVVVYIHLEVADDIDFKK